MNGLRVCVVLLLCLALLVVGSDPDDDDDNDMDVVDEDWDPDMDEDSDPGVTGDSNIQELTKPDGSKTISMSTHLGEEDTQSPFLPDSLKCDACRVIAHLLYTSFEKQHKKMKSLIEKKGRLRESDVIEIIETVCENSFDDIGVKEVNGVKRLSGPGLETYNTAGMMQSGGKWPHRLRSICGTYTGDVGEEHIYLAYLKLKDKLENYLCRGKGVRGDCVTGKQKSNKTKRDKKEEL